MSAASVASSARGVVSGIYRRVMMVNPSHFDVIHRNLNPHMTCDRPVNRERAWDQWRQLRTVFERHGLESVTCEPVPGAVDMVFSANSAIVMNNKALIANMAAAPRKVEQPAFADWYRSQGFEVAELDKIAKPYTYCEGNAELSPTSDLSLYFFGWGQRTAESAYDPILDFFSLSPSDVYKVRLVDERFYHLDTCMAPLALGHILYYPGAFDKDGLRTIHEGAGSEDGLIAVTEEEAMAFTCNSVSFISPITGAAVVVSPNFSPRLRAILEGKGYTCERVEYDEFLLSGGAVRCTVADIAQTRAVG